MNIKRKPVYEENDSENFENEFIDKMTVENVHQILIVESIFSKIGKYFFYIFSFLIGAIVTILATLVVILHFKAIYIPQFNGIIRKNFHELNFRTQEIFLKNNFTPTIRIKNVSIQNNIHFKNVELEIDLAQSFLKKKFIVQKFIIQDPRVLINNNANIFSYSVNQNVFDRKNLSHSNLNTKIIDFIKKYNFEVTNGQIIVQKNNQIVFTINECNIQKGKKSFIEIYSKHFNKNTSIKIRHQKINNYDKIVSNFSNVPTNYLKLLTKIKLPEMNGFCNGEVISFIDTAGKIKHFADLEALNSSIKIENQNLQFDKILLSAEISNNICNINKILFSKSENSNISIDNIKITEEGLFFNSTLSCFNVNNEIFNIIRPIIDHKLKFISSCNVKNADFKLGGRFLNDNDHHLKIQNATFNLSKANLTLNEQIKIISSNIKGEISTHSPDVKLFINSGIFNNISQIEKGFLSYNDQKVKLLLNSCYPVKNLENIFLSNQILKNLHIKFDNGYLKGTARFLFDMKNLNKFSIGFNGNLITTNSTIFGNNIFSTNNENPLKIIFADDVMQIDGQITLNHEPINLKLDTNNKFNCYISGKLNSNFLNQIIHTNIFQGMTTSEIKFSGTKNHAKELTIISDISHSKMKIKNLINLKNVNSNGLLKAKGEFNNNKLASLNYEINSQENNISGNIIFNETSANEIKSFFIESYGSQNFQLSAKKNHSSKISNDIDIKINGSNLTLNDVNFLKYGINGKITANLSNIYVNHNSCPFAIKGHAEIYDGFLKNAKLFFTFKNKKNATLTSIYKNGTSHITLNSTSTANIFNLMNISQNISDGELNVKCINHENGHILGSFEIRNFFIKNQDSFGKMIAMTSIAPNLQDKVGFNIAKGNFDGINNKLALNNVQLIGPIMCISLHGFANMKHNSLNINGDIFTNLYSKKTPLKSRFSISGDVENPLINVEPMNESTENELKDYLKIKK